MRGGAPSLILKEAIRHCLKDSLQGPPSKDSLQGPPSGRHATLEGEYHPLKLNFSGENTLTRPCQFKAPSVPPEGGLKGSWQGPPSGRHATLQGEYHPLKLNLSGQNNLTRPCQLKAPLVPPEGVVQRAPSKEYLQGAMRPFRGITTLLNLT